MGELFHHPLREEEWFGILALVVVVGFIGLKVLRVVLAHVRAGQEHDAAVALKMEMIQRGMSADEIERILAAKIIPLEPSVAGQVGRAAGEMVRGVIN